VVPIDSYNQTVHPTTPLAAGTQLAGLGAEADTDPGGLLTPIDYLTTSCVYTVALADQPPVTPEFPAPAIAGLAAAGVLGLAALRRRRAAA
jgi:MYXO-CTERM domain-containing protein